MYDDEMNPKDKDSKAVRPPSVPNLRRLDTKSAERLRDVPKLPVPCSPSYPSFEYLAPPHSPTRLNLKSRLIGLCGNNPLSNERQLPHAIL